MLYINSGHPTAHTHTHTVRRICIVRLKALAGLPSLCLRGHGGVVGVCLQDEWRLEDQRDQWRSAFAELDDDHDG